MGPYGHHSEFTTCVRGESLPSMNRGVRERVGRASLLYEQPVECMGEPGEGEWTSAWATGACQGTPGEGRVFRYQRDVCDASSGRGPVW
jgi:hypothetical protein